MFLPLLLLAACATTPTPAQQGAAARARYEQRMANDHEFCFGFGARPGTKLYADCREAQIRRHEQEIAAAAASRGSPERGLNAAAGALLAIEPDNKGLTCTTQRQLGGNSITNCF
jgi:starvation-inducible outer membrane lipoprotein